MKTWTQNLTISVHSIQAIFFSPLFLAGCQWLLLSSLLFATQPLHLISTIAVSVWVRWVSHLSQWPVISRPGWIDASLCAARCWLICVPVRSRSLTQFCVLLNVASFFGLRLELQRRSRMVCRRCSGRKTSGRRCRKWRFKNPLKFGLFVAGREKGELEWNSQPEMLLSSQR